MDGAEIFGCDELERVREWAPDRIAVAGGDGTIGPVAELAGALGVPLAVIPAGTANDFARANGIPLDVDAGRAAGRRGHDAARAGARPAGRRAAVRERRQRGPVVRRRAARAAAEVALRAARLRHGRRAGGGDGPAAERARAVDDEVVFDGGAWQVMVACTGAFGGGSGIGVADATDGDLDVVIIPAGSRIGLVKRAWGLRTKRLERQRRSCTTRAGSSR